MSETLAERLTKTPEGMRLYQQERAILELTEMICDVMDEGRITRAELARCLGKGKGHITQLLDGMANMTIRTMSDIFTAMGRSLHFREGPLTTSNRGAWIWAPITREPDEWKAAIQFPQEHPGSHDAPIRRAC